MARYTKESIDRLRDTIDMAELVGTRTDLRRVGSRMVGLCPFHDERTPSFSIDPVEKLYHCFGCGVGGDAFSFISETENLPFGEAVELLGDRYGVELKLEQENPAEEQRRKHRDRLLALLDRAAGFYEKFLWKAEEAGDARAYLAGRGLSEEILKEFRVGYAPKAWDRLLTGAQSDGFSISELRASGLAKDSQRGSMDAFRERIMFPLADSRGRVLGFGARAMRDDQGAKYINTSENDIYHKRRQLFGIDLARHAASKAGRVVVVEGYTDVLALHQGGIRETVAIMGTSLTESQIAELARVAGGEGTVYLALDADSSGQQAMLRAAKMAESRELELRVVRMPDGVDPAEMVAADGPDGFAKLLDTSLSVLEFSVEQVLATSSLGTPDGRDRALSQSGELIAAAPPRSARRDHLVRLVADRLDMPIDYVVSAVERGPAKSQAPAGGESRAPAPQMSAPVGAVPGAHTPETEQVFLSLCLAGGSAGREMLGRVEPGHFSSSVLDQARQHLIAHFDDPLSGLEGADRQFAYEVAQIALHAGESGRTEESTLEMGFLQLELRRIDRELRNVRQEGDLDRQAKLAGERQRVRSEMDDLMGRVT